MPLVSPQGMSKKPCIRQKVHNLNGITYKTAVVFIPGLKKMLLNCAMVYPELPDPGLCYGRVLKCVTEHAFPGDTYMDKSGDGPVPLSARIPRWLSVEVKVLPVKGRP